MNETNDILGIPDYIDSASATGAGYLYTAYDTCNEIRAHIDGPELTKKAIDEYIYNIKKEKEDETELQGKDTPVTRGTGNKECRIRSGRNKTRVTLRHLSYKTIS